MKLLIFFNDLDCEITLKPHSSGWIDSTTIPNRSKNCTFNFSPAIQNRVDTQAPGLLIKLLKLNVPCENGGFIQFDRTNKLCGKLEELPENQRTLYFNSRLNTVLNVYNHPNFQLVYKSVDYCYNVTLLDQSGSFEIKQTSEALRCHIKIHLPFGNKIALKLRLRNSISNAGSEQDAAAYEEIKINQTSEKRLNKRDTSYNKVLQTPDISSETEYSFSLCNGIFIEVIDRSEKKWFECIIQSKAISGFVYTLTSSDNVVFIRILKASEAISRDALTTASQIRDYVISVEYTAVAIKTIVSTCAFGYVLAGEFCVSSFHDLLSWQSAESRCKDIGGHLASIRSDTQHDVIDEMILNR